MAGAVPSADKSAAASCVGGTLHRAISNNNLALVKLLLEHGADLTLCAGGSIRRTPLEDAHHEGKWEFVEIIARKSKTVFPNEAYYYEAITLAMVARRITYFQIANTLVDNCPSSARHVKILPELLSYALKVNAIDIAKCLIKTAISHCNGELLSVAVATKYPEAIALLQQHAANWSETMKKELLAKYAMLRSLQEKVLDQKWTDDKVILQFGLGITLFSSSPPWHSTVTAGLIGFTHCDH